MQRTLILLNSAAGLVETGSQRVRQALAAAGLNAEVRAVAPRQLASAARAAVKDGIDILVAGGGDGTVRTVAEELIGSPSALGVLPVGTLNHFARDLGIPPDLEAAARVLGSGAVRNVDVGEVNGRCFLNNASIGLYPRMVIRRETQRERLGRGKWTAMAIAAWSVLRRHPLVRVTLQVAGQTRECKTPILFVANNRYVIDLLRLGRRWRLDGGELSVYLAHADTRAGLLLLAARMLLGRLRQPRDFESFPVPDLRIQTRKHTVRIALDGELIRLRPPLEYRVRPGALRVIAP